MKRGKGRKKRGKEGGEVGMLRDGFLSYHQAIAPRSETSTRYS
jgi:hypothetical protein